MSEMMTLKSLFRLAIAIIFFPFRLTLIVLAAGIGIFEPDLADVIADFVHLNDKFRLWKDREE